jgi:hypothetical protein
MNGLLGLDRDFFFTFYIIFPNFKVLDFFLEIVGYASVVKGDGPDILEIVFYI